MRTWIACSFVALVVGGSCLLVGASSGCGGGGCSSVDVPGSFRVVSTGSAGDGGATDGGTSGGQIVLAFTADDVSKRQSFDATVYYKGDTTASRLDSCPTVEAGVTVGQTFRGTRTDESGSCGPQPYRCSP